MKTLKLDHDLADAVRAGTKKTTWRMFDDKDLTVNDVVRLIDKVDPAQPEGWQNMGSARIVQVVEKRLDNLTRDEMLEHGYGSEAEVLTTFQKYYGNDVSYTTPIKIIKFIYDNNQQIKDDLYTTNSYKNLKIYTDGGSRGNPGPSASGFVIVDAVTEQLLADKGVYLGVTTNNQAEYLALKYALEEARRMGAQEVTVYLDSMLVVEQMNGALKVRNRDLWPVHEAIKGLVTGFKHISFVHIPREQNMAADAAVNRALDQQADSIRLL